MEHSKFFSTALAVAMLAIPAGCVSLTPNLDGHFGDSVALVKAQQTMYPEASRNNDPVRGIDGAAAKGAYDAYQKSYQTKEAPQSQSAGATIITVGR